MRKLSYFIATFAGAGYVPVAPGTAGTLVAALLAYFVFQGDFIWLLLSAVFGTAIGVLSANHVESDLGQEDPGIVVIDEAVGMWIGLLGVALQPWWHYILAFGLFRLFDIAKPFPINHSQKLPGGWGIMIDDVLAGVYTLAVMSLLNLWVL